MNGFFRLPQLSPTSEAAAATGASGIRSESSCSGVGMHADHSHHQNNAWFPNSHHPTTAVPTLPPILGSCKLWPSCWHTARDCSGAHFLDPVHSSLVLAHTKSIPSGDLNQFSNSSRLQCNSLRRRSGDRLQRRCDRAGGHHGVSIAPVALHVDDGDFYSGDGRGDSDDHVLGGVLLVRS